MKKIFTAISTLIASLALMGGVAFAAPTPPAECTGTYTKTVVLNSWGAYYPGTAARELIIVNGGGAYVVAAGGADCVVLNSGQNLVYGGAGQDVIVANVGGNSLYGDAANDDIYSRGGGDYINGGTGTDLCEYDYNTTSANSCEL